MSKATSTVFSCVHAGSGLCVSHTQAAPYKVVSSGEFNEDELLIHQVDDDSVLLAVADGLGGQASGHEASALVVQCLQEALTDHGHTRSSLREPILDALERCNHLLLKRADGAATTAAVVEIQGCVIRPYHVGDSSILVVGQRGRVKFQSISHSPIGLGIEAGLLDEDAATQHDERHWILNFLGSSEMRIEVGAPLTLSRFDTLMICSDGLTDNLTIPAIADVIRKGPLSNAMRKLDALCHDSMLSTNGHPDDLSVVLYRPNCKTRAKRAKRTRAGKRII